MFYKRETTEYYNHFGDFNGSNLCLKKQLTFFEKKFFVWIVALAVSEKGRFLF